jgi:DnaJ like chaperone protein
MTVWQKISDLATVVGDAGGSLLDQLGRTFGVNRPDGEPLKDIGFTIAVIALSAKMAKADGVVSPLELKAFADVFRYSPEEARNVERVFDMAKQDTAGYEAYADQIAGLLKDDRKLLQHVLEGLMYVGTADGVLHPQEDEFLKSVATRFGFSDSEYRFFRARFVVDNANPYDALRLTPEASDAEVKAQYRKLVRDNHPDRLMANGVPAEFIELATRKLAAINDAYDIIARERGL